jgi:hypothetical protein
MGIPSSVILQGVYPSNNNNHIFMVGNGNNSELIRRILKTRKNWIEYDGNGPINFRWTQNG